MKKTSLSMSLATVLVTALVVSGCHKKANDTAATPAIPVVAASSPDSGAWGGTASSLPVECDSYMKRLEVCVNKVSAVNPAAANAARQMLESIRQQWSTAKDKAALLRACKQANDNIQQPNDKVHQIMAAQGCN